MDLTTPLDGFASRHLGSDEQNQKEMLAVLGIDSLASLVDSTVPKHIRTQEPLQLGPPRGEAELLEELRLLAGQNRIMRSYIGMGYYGTRVPGVIARNILENPGWYTQYTPYQAEIAQGRLEALLNFQTMISDLTGLPLANASLLDEGTAAAEAMAMTFAVAQPASGGKKRTRFFISEDCHPQTVAVVQTRAKAAGIEVTVGACTPSVLDENTFGVLVQVPGSQGTIEDIRGLAEAVHAAGAVMVVATDLLACTLLASPGELGADVAIGSAQRFGVPLGYGGPHAAFLAATQKYQRLIPGRVVGVSKDVHGRPAFRLALQTREQHIRRERATSNICTAQVLLAVMASMYAVYHGPKGLRRIAQRVHDLTAVLVAGLGRLGFAVPGSFFDTVTVTCERASEVHRVARARGINLREVSATRVGVSLDETVTLDDVQELLDIFAEVTSRGRVDAAQLGAAAPQGIPESLRRTGDILTHEIFNRYHSETEMLRYMRRLELKDLALNESMIPLGSCTMKLNATAEMAGLSMPGITDIHPFVPREQVPGYQKLVGDMEKMIASITGLPGVSLQPNAGSQGELTGLLVIRAFHEARGEAHRNVCLIPASAHGTNPASAAMAGMRVVVVRCDAKGNIDLTHLSALAAEHQQNLGALMVTYPSTHGVFETTIAEICQVVHAHGGQVYMDGANLNAMVGLCRPADIGVDVVHLNLHKTFAIPHGGGGPGMGPIAAASHLAPFLPGHPVVPTGGEQAIGPVAAAPYGSASILTISWAYMMLMGGEGLRRATEMAILNANYMAKRLEPHYPILYRGEGGRVAHEFIIDLRPLKESANVTVDDVAKRLMDYGYHAPTMSWPVAGTMMIEPTESESKAELDRFCDAMIAIRKEIAAIESGELDKNDNPLKHAPHTSEAVIRDDWSHAYSRELAAFPLPSLRHHKFWPSVGRIDNTHGDRHFICTCPPLEEYA